MRLWRVSSSDREKDLPQSLHVCGFSEAGRLLPAVVFFTPSVAATFLGSVTSSFNASVTETSDFRLARRCDHCLSVASTEEARRTPLGDRATCLKGGFTSTGLLAAGTESKRSAPTVRLRTCVAGGSVKPFPPSVAPEEAVATAAAAAWSVEGHGPERNWSINWVELSKVEEKKVAEQRGERMERGVGGFGEREG